MKPYACYPNMSFRPHRVVFGQPRTTPATAPTQETRASYPAANIHRREDAYVIDLAVPGLTKDQIRIDLEKDQLIISAVKPDTAGALKYTRKEFDYTGFKRVFRLHANADTDRLTATCQQGVLTVVIPDKTPETIKINIQ